MTSFGTGNTNYTFAPVTGGITCRSTTQDCLFLNGGTGQRIEKFAIIRPSNATGGCSMHIIGLANSFFDIGFINAVDAICMGEAPGGPDASGAFRFYRMNGNVSGGLGSIFRDLGLANGIIANDTLFSSYAVGSVALKLDPGVGIDTFIMHGGNLFAFGSLFNVRPTSGVAMSNLTFDHLLADGFTGPVIGWDGGGGGAIDADVKDNYFGAYNLQTSSATITLTGVPQAGQVVTLQVHDTTTAQTNTVTYTVGGGDTLAVVGAALRTAINATNAVPATGNPNSYLNAVAFANPTFTFTTLRGSQAQGVTAQISETGAGVGQTPSGIVPLLGGDPLNNVSSAYLFQGGGESAVHFSGNTVVGFGQACLNVLGSVPFALEFHHERWGGCGAALPGFGPAISLGVGTGNVRFYNSTISGTGNVFQFLGSNNSVVVEGGDYSSPSAVINGIANLTNSTFVNANGINPVGNLTPPSVSATTVALVNPFPYSVIVYVSGGTVSQVAIDGTNTGLTSGGFRVNPGGSIKLTYTVAPTWTWNAN
jgi:hypothetical protein